jgi:hypothetical protein
MPDNFKNQCAIFVSSCDAFQDAWGPFFTLFFRYWTDCPYPVYLIANQKKYFDNRVETILISPDQGWASNMKIALERHSYLYIIYFQEDYFLRSKVDNTRINSLLEIMAAENAACVRLWPSPTPDKSFKSYSDLGLISLNAPYRVSLQATIWNAKIFKDLLVAGESGRDMEFDGSIRSQKIFEPFLSVKLSPVFKFNNNSAIDYYATGIVKGKWNYGVINFLKKEGITVDTNKRTVEPLFRYLSRELRGAPVIGGVMRLIFRITGKLRRWLKK